MCPPGRGADAAVGVSQALAVLLVHLWGGEENRQLVAGAPTQRSAETKLRAGIRNLSCPPSSQPGRLLSRCSGPSSVLHLHQFLIHSMTQQLFNTYPSCVRHGLGSGDNQNKSDIKPYFSELLF